MPRRPLPFLSRAVPLLAAVLVGAPGCLDFAVAPGALRCDSSRTPSCPRDWRCVPETLGDPIGRCYPPDVLVTVAPTYPESPGWQDYVRRSDPSRPHYAQPGELCDPERDDAIGDCVHAGELRVARTTLSSCEGLDVRDALDALQWSCDDSDGHAALHATGLREEAALGDLLEAAAFKPNRVLARQGADGPLVAVSAPAVWWNNPVRPLPVSDADPIPLAEPGAIYTAARDTACGSYDIGADRVAVVALPGATLTLRDGTSCALTTTDGLRHPCLFGVADRRFVWLEGRVHGSGAAFGVHAAAVRYLRLRRMRISGFWHSGVAARELSTARLEDVVANHNGQGGINVTGAQLVLTRLAAFGNGYRETNPGHHGVLLNAASDSVLTRATAGSNTHYGLMTNEGGARNTIGLATTGLNGYTGVGLNAGAESTLFQIVSLRQGSAGIAIRTLDNQLAGAALGHQAVAVGLADKGGVTLTHDLVLAANDKDCTATGAVPCTEWGSPRVIPVASLARTLAGKVVADEPQNESDAGGAADLTQIDDWLGFATRHRGWGADGSDPFADASNVGVCKERCRIWDLALGADADALRARDGDGEPARDEVGDGAPCPAAVDGDVALTDRSGNTFLLHAHERLGDGLGDEDGLCESHEGCVYRPHTGDAQAYTGVGSARCVFRDGAVRDVRMHGLRTPQQ